MAINTKKAAVGTRNLLETITAKRDEEGKTLEHAAWMLDEIISENIEGEKAHRWLGYAQGLIVLEGKATMADFKVVNKDAKIDETQIMVKSEVDRLLNVLSQAHKDLEEVRKQCTHSNGSYEGYWSWFGDPSRATKREICNTCGMPIDNYFENDDPFKDN